MQPQKLKDQLFINDLPIQDDGIWHHLITTAEVINVRIKEEVKPVTMKGISKSDHSLQFISGTVVVSFKA